MLEITSTTSYDASGACPASIRLTMFEPVPEIRTATRVLATDMGGSRVEDGVTAMRPRRRLSKRDGRVAGEGVGAPNHCRLTDANSVASSETAALASMRRGVRHPRGSILYASSVDRRLRSGPVGRAGRFHGSGSRVQRRLGAGPLGLRASAQRHRRPDREE